MSFFDELSESLPTPNDNWTKTDILLYRLIQAQIAGSTDMATQTTLSAILAKLLTAPATEAKQDTGNTSLATIAGKDFATQTTLSALLALQYATKGNELQGVTGVITTTASTPLIQSPSLTEYVYLTSLLVTNSHATQGTVVQLINTADDTIVWAGYAAPAGGGFAITFPTPLKACSPDWGVEVKCLTAGASVIVSAVGFKTT